MFEGFRALLDDDPEADAGLVMSGYIVVAPPGAASDAIPDHAQVLDKHFWQQLDDIDAIGFEAEAGLPTLMPTSNRIWTRWSKKPPRPPPVCQPLPKDL